MTRVPRAGFAAVRPVVRLAGLPVLCTAAALVIGLPVAYAVAVGLGVLALRSAVQVLTGSPASVPPWAGYLEPERHGARRQFAEMTWSLTGSSRSVSEKALRELRPVAQARLQRLGVDLTAPESDGAARELLGERAWATLTNPGGALPRLADIEHVVTVLERLEPALGTAAGTVSRKPSLAPTPEASS